jgi:hypothetical protein
VNLEQYCEEIIFFRSLILDGLFEEAEQFIQSFQKYKYFNYKEALYAIKKQAFLELIETGVKFF